MRILPLDYEGDGGPATQASFANVYDVAVDTSGNLYIADGGNYRIRKVSTFGNISTFAGTGNTGYSGDGGPATQANINYPQCVCVDIHGNVYFEGTEAIIVGDLGNIRYRKVDTNGIITTVAGNGSSIYSGDGGPATQAGIGAASGISVDEEGNLYIGDGYNNRIRKVDTNGIITTVAGNGTSGYSGDGGPATQAGIGGANGLSFDEEGNLYIADGDNSRIRKVDTNGIITTVAGNGIYGYSGDGGPALQATLGWPGDVKVDASGNLYILDMDYSCIRKVGSIPDVISGTNGAVNVALYQLDYEGDGIIDASATTLDGLKSYLTHVYTSNGLYYPTIKVTDSAGKVYRKSTVVNVSQPPNLGGKWSGMKSALQTGDIASATNYFSPTTRDLYSQQFQVLKDAGLLGYTAADMGDWTMTKFFGNFAQGEMVITIDGVSYSYYVLYVKDADGIWRIRSF